MCLTNGNLARKTAQYTSDSCIQHVTVKWDGKKAAWIEIDFQWNVSKSSPQFGQLELNKTIYFRRYWCLEVVLKWLFCGSMLHHSTLASHYSSEMIPFYSPHFACPNNYLLLTYDSPFFRLSLLSSTKFTSSFSLLTFPKKAKVCRGVYIRLNLRRSRFIRIYSV